MFISAGRRTLWPTAATPAEVRRSPKQQAKQDATPWALPLDEGLVPSGSGTCFFAGNTCRLLQETLQITHLVKKDERGKPTSG